MEKKKQSLVKGKGKGKPIAKPRLKGAKTSTRSRSLTGKTFTIPEVVKELYTEMERLRRNHNVCPGLLQKLFHTKLKYLAVRGIFEAETEKVLPFLKAYDWIIADPENPYISVLEKLR